MGTVSDPRWPVAPLMEALERWGLAPTPAKLARLVHVDIETAEAAIADGLTTSQAEQWCRTARIPVDLVWDAFACLPEGAVFEDPPERQNKKGRPAVWPALVEPLKLYPGRWVRLREFDRASAAASAGGRIRKLGGFETKTVKNAETGRGVLYVRFMGDDAVVPMRRKAG